MNWAAWSPAFVTVIFWIFTAGMTIGRIKNQEDALKSHDDRLNDVDDRLDGVGTKLENLGNRMTASEAWREGYNAGRSK